MVTIIIAVALMFVECNISAALSTCHTLPFSSVGTLMAAGVEILFEIKGVISIMRVKNKDGE